MSLSSPHKHLVFLGSGQVNRAIASFVLSHWWTSTNAVNNFNDNNKITFITRDPEGVFEGFVADDVPFLLESSSSFAFGRNQNPLSILRKQISICEFSNKMLRHKLLFDSTSTSAVFCAVPLHHASSYLDAAFSCITNHDENNSMLTETQKKTTPPIFIMSRGISLQEPVMSNGTAAKPRGLATTYQRRDLVTSQKNQNICANNNKKMKPFWSAPTYFLENQNRNFNINKSKIDPGNFHSLGGLLSHELFRDAAFAKHVLFSQRQNAEKSEESAIPIFASEIVTPPTLLLGSVSEDINSKNDDENKVSKKISVKKMLKEDFGLDTRTLFEHNDEESDLETCALVDALIIPASLGGGITKAASQQAVSTLLTSRQLHSSANANNNSNLHTVVQKSLGNYQTTVANDSEKLIKYHLHNRGQSFSKLDSLCSTFISQACNVALGYAGVRNVPELGRRVVTGECETSEDAEAQLFPQNSGHGEAFHSTLEALAHLSHQQQQQQQNENVVMTDNSFTVVADFISGYHSSNVCARWLLHNKHNYNSNNNNNNIDEDGNEEGLTSSSSSSLLQPDRPHYLLEDLQRLDEAVIKGEVESNADFLKLLKSVKAVDQMQGKDGAPTNIYTMPKK